MILNQHLYHDHAVITLEHELSTSTASMLCRQIRSLVDDYRYEHIEIQIPNNPGGLIAAMEMIGRQMSGIQAQGVTVSTFGLGTVASAAAITLSRGTLGQRAVDEGAMLLYHLGRVQSPSHVTAKVAKQVSKHLDLIDARVLRTLVKHILPLTQKEDTDGDSIWQWPLEPITEDDSSLGAAEQRSFGSPETCQQYMFQTLQQLFEADTLMTPQTAKSLGLIDQIRQ